MKDQTEPPALTASGEGEGAPAVTRPTLVQAARSLAELNRPYEGDATRGLAAAQLLHSLQVEGAGETHLHLHIRTLDALFNRLILKSVENRSLRPRSRDAVMHADYALLALQAQRQCRHAVETLINFEKRKSKNKLKDAPI